MRKSKQCTVAIETHFHFEVIFKMRMGALTRWKAFSNHRGMNSAVNQYKQVMTEISSLRTCEENNTIQTLDKSQMKRTSHLSSFNLNVQTVAPLKHQYIDVN